MDDPTLMASVDSLHDPMHGDPPLILIKFAISLDHGPQIPALGKI
jgi:hypothetical protein